MTSEAVFIQVGALADGFAPHGNLLATASLPAGENFTFYVAGSEPQQLVIEDEQTLSWNGKRAPWRATALRPDILFIDFLDPERDNASISAVCNLTQRNATLVYGQLPDEALTAIRAHNAEMNGASGPASRFDYALRCGETVTGLISAAALMRPTGMEGMEVKSIKKKMKDKAFAASVCRDNIRQCAEAGLELDEFLALSIEAMHTHSAELGLSK